MALKRIIDKRFTEEDWVELGYATGLTDAIRKHPRLLRSLYYGDPDYGAAVLDWLETMYRRDPCVLDMIADFVNLDESLKEIDPKLHAEVFGAAGLSPLSDTEQFGEVHSLSDLEKEITRIKESISGDTALAIGSAKEMLETVLKMVLGLHGHEIGPYDFPNLVKAATEQLGLHPGSVDKTIPAFEHVKRLCGSLTTITLAVNEIRNVCGTGHGKSQGAYAEQPEARLVVNAAATVATYLLEKYLQSK